MFRGLVSNTALAAWCNKWILTALSISNYKPFKMTTFPALSCFICRKDIGNSCGCTVAKKYIFLTGSFEKYHHYDGKIFCQEDFDASGHSRNSKFGCYFCGMTIYRDPVQVLHYTVTNEYCLLTGRDWILSSSLLHMQYLWQNVGAWILLSGLWQQGAVCSRLLPTVLSKMLWMQSDNCQSRVNWCHGQDTGKALQSDLSLVSQLQQAMDRDYHVGCFCCEICGTQLSNDSGSR